MTQEFEDLLRLDPLLEAEKLTGKSYKEDEGTSSLGFVLMLEKNQRVTDEMELRDDTHYNTAWETTVRIYGELGFEPILTEDFENDRGLTETHILWWRNGLLAHTESYARGDGTRTTNRSELYGNWLPRPADRDDRWQYTQSGHFARHTPGFDGEFPDDPWTWIGDWDARTGLRNLIDRLDGAGEFVTPWVEWPVMSLSHYADRRETVRGADWLEHFWDQTIEMVDRLPEHVRTAMGSRRE